MRLRAARLSLATAGAGCQAALRIRTHLWLWLPSSACPACLHVALAPLSMPVPHPKGSSWPLLCPHSLAQAQASHQNLASWPGCSPALSPQTSRAVGTTGCPPRLPCSLAELPGSQTDPSCEAQPGPREQPLPLCLSPCLVATATPEYSKCQPPAKTSPQANSGVKSLSDGYSLGVV